MVTNECPVVFKKGESGGLNVSTATNKLVIINREETGDRKV